MADVPTFQDLYQTARRRALSGVTPYTPEIIDTDGSDVNILYAGAATMGQEVARYAQRRFDEGHLSTALRIGGDVLIRWVQDRYQFEKRGSIASVVPVQFQRTSTTSRVVPAGTVVATDDGIQFSTINDLVFGTNILGPLTVNANALVTGPSGDVAIGAIRNIVTALDDTTITVTNVEPGAGGAPEETDEAYAARARDFIANARRGTLSAVLTGARNTPGVEQADVLEILDPDGTPAWRGQCTISNAAGLANSALAARVRLQLEEYRGLGVPVPVVGGTPTYIRIVYSGLQFRTGSNTTTVLDQARAALTAEVNATPPNRTLMVSRLDGVISRVPQLLVPEGSRVEPAGDVVPTAGQVIRTTTDRVELSG